jgi:hypothetical protein
MNAEGAEAAETREVSWVVGSANLAERETESAKPTP